MKKKAALLSFSISSVMVLGACGGNDVPSGEEAEQELEELGEEVTDDLNEDAGASGENKNDNQDSQEKNKDQELADKAEPYHEDMSKGDPVLAEGEVTYESYPGEEFNPYDDYVYTISKDALGEEVYWSTIPEDASVQMGDEVKVVGTYDGVNEDTGIPLVKGESIEVVGSNNPDSDDYANEDNEEIPEDAVTIEDEVFYASKDYEDAEEYTHSYYAKVKNNTEESYDLDGSSVTWYDENDEMINVTDDYSVWVYPNILMPDEEALIEVTEDYMAEDNIADVELLLSPSPAGSDYETEYLDIEKVSINDRPAVVGQYTNTLDEEAGNAYVASAFYDSDDKLVGVSALQVHDLISPGETTAFEYGLPSMTSEAYESIEYEETEAFELQGYAQAE